ncbi:unnamed protein product [Prorocentrum cordatum]|uniref:Uncharacterized protein n=1 Tax=Prorocentrum cordatum TaxID=2364126 RepID=A0ABN9Q5M2_9DINO|nr:unnamed protein product [Polarella glacialis]
MEAELRQERAARHQRALRRLQASAGAGATAARVRDALRDLLGIEATAEQTGRVMRAHGLRGHDGRFQLSSEAEAAAFAQAVAALAAWDQARAEEAEAAQRRRQLRERQLRERIGRRRRGPGARGGGAPRAGRTTTPAGQFGCWPSCRTPCQLSTAFGCMAARSPSTTWQPWPPSVGSCPRAPWMRGSWRRQCCSS